MLYYSSKGRKTIAVQSKDEEVPEFDDIEKVDKAVVKDGSEAETPTQEHRNQFRLRMIPLDI